ISAAVGTGVQVSGSGFSSSDTSCSLSGTPISLPTCSVYSGGSLVGSFIVANVAIGSYTITATGTQAGDHASASFTVSGGFAYHHSQPDFRFGRIYCPSLRFRIFAK